MTTSTRINFINSTKNPTSHKKFFSSSNIKEAMFRKTAMLKPTTQTIYEDNFNFNYNYNNNNINDIIS